MDGPREGEEGARSEVRRASSSPSSAPPPAAHPRLLPLARSEVRRAAVAKVILRCVGGAAERERSEASHTPGSVPLGTVPLAVLAADREQDEGEEVVGRDDAAPSPSVLSPRMCCNVLLRLCRHL